MQLDRSNILAYAEKYVSRTLTAQELVWINQQLRADTDLKAEWIEAVEFMKDLKEGSAMMEARRQAQSLTTAYRTIQADAPAIHTSRESGSVWLKTWKRYGRMASVAASLAVVASTVTFYLATNTNKIHNQNEFISLKRDVEHIRTSQEEMKQTMDEAENEIDTPDITGNVIGTGFAITNDGYLATDYHVVENADSIFIQTYNGHYYKAYVVGYDATNDIAVLKVEDPKFKFGNGDIPYTVSSSGAGLAQSIYSLGFPQDDALYSEGYISSQKGLSGDKNSYQLDLPANPGQSGSPIFDRSGNVIGMLIGKKTFSTYAIKSQILLDLIKSLPKEYKIQPSSVNNLKPLSRQDQVRKTLDYVCAVRVYKR